MALKKEGENCILKKYKRNTKHQNTIKKEKTKPFDKFLDIHIAWEYKIQKEQHKFIHEKPNLDKIIKKYPIENEVKWIKLLSEVKVNLWVTIHKRRRKLILTW